MTGIRRGFVPSFHFKRLYRMNDERDQHRAITLKHEDVENAIGDVNEYINHRPHQCKPDYRMCFEQCSAAAKVARMEDEPVRAVSVGTYFIPTVQSASLSNFKYPLYCPRTDSQKGMYSTRKSSYRQGDLCELYSAHPPVIRSRRISSSETISVKSKPIF